MFGGKFVGMRYVYLLILIQFTGSSCTTDNSGSFALPSTSTSESTSFFSNSLLKGPSSDNDLSNKGLICKVGIFAEFLTNVGYYFPDGKTFEKWFNASLIKKTDGFEFVRIDTDAYTSYDVKFQSIKLNYADDINSVPYQSGRETIDRITLEIFFGGGKVGDCKVVY